jgi:hypothetical protein
MTMLRKPVAMLLLVIYLFDIGGQVMLHRYFAYLSDKFFTEQTAKGLYNKGDLTEVKLPVNMPGIAEWRAYENISGSVRFNDVTYNYVKMKMTRTAICLMCVPDYATTRFSRQNVIDAKHDKGVPVPKKDHVPYGKIATTGKFSITFRQFAFAAPATTINGVVIPLSQQLVTQYRDIPRQPPKSIC